MSTRALANLHCATYNETWMHERNVCRRCGTPNQSSGNPPVPRPAQSRFNAHVGKHFDAALEQASARRRARAARHQQLSRGVSTK